MKRRPELDIDTEVGAISVLQSTVKLFTAIVSGIVWYTLYDNDVFDNNLCCIWVANTFSSGKVRDNFSQIIDNYMISSVSHCH